MAVAAGRGELSEAGLCRALDDLIAVWARIGGGSYTNDLSVRREDVADRLEDWAARLPRETSE